jgi:hypothetical protein
MLAQPLMIASSNPNTSTCAQRRASLVNPGDLAGILLALRG